MKKTLNHPKADPEKRKAYQILIDQYVEEGRSIVYIDESGFSVDSPRLYGYSQKGARCLGVHNWHEKGRINVIGALLDELLLTTCLFDCYVDSDVFHAWVIQDLLPIIPKNSVVVLDNATFHKRSDTQFVIQNASHTLLYLPPYSPDLNPIEHTWAQLKAIRRKRRCSVYDLFDGLSYKSLA